MFAKIRMFCPNCPAMFEPTHHRQLYCSATCRQEFTDRKKVRGQLIVTEMQAHRLARYKRGSDVKDLDQEAWAAIRRRVDEWNQEDRAAGRPDALTVLRRDHAVESGRRP